MSKHVKARLEEKPAGLPTPREIIQHLDRTVIGQEHAKRALASAVYTHYLADAYRFEPGARHSSFGPQHVLLIGPTGTGKTELVRRLADLLQVPITFGVATSLAEVGYKGESVESLLRSLLDVAGRDESRAARGIIFLDEIDKIQSYESGVRDVSGEGVQNALLTLLDGRRSEFTDLTTNFRFQLDVSRVLFVCAGAFTTLPGVVRRRLHARSGIGFASSSPGVGASAGIETDEQAYALAMPEDLVECGFIPELIGRFGTIAALRPLSAADLRLILERAEESVLAKQKELYALHGVELIVTERALQELCKRCDRQRLGARGLGRILSEALRGVTWRLPDLRREGAGRVVVTAEAIRGDAEPMIVACKDGSDRNDTCGGSTRPRLRDRSRDLRTAALRSSVFGEPGARPRPERRGSVSAQMEAIKPKLAFETAPDTAKRWWLALEQENSSREHLMLELAQDLLRRRATIGDLYDAIVRGNTDDISAALAFMEYERAKERAAKRRGGADRGAPPRPGS